MKVKIPIPEAPVSAALLPEAPVENEADIIKLWEEVKKVTPVIHLLEHAQRIMSLLESNDLRKEFCSVLIAPEFLDTAMCPPLFGWQEVGEEPDLDELRDALGKINLHQFAIETWVDLSSKKRKTE